MNVYDWLKKKKKQKRKNIFKRAAKNNQKVQL